MVLIRVTLLPLTALQAVLYELVSPGDRFLCLPRPGSSSKCMLAFPRSKGVVGSVFSSGNAVMTEHPKLLPLFDPEVDQPSKKYAPHAIQLLLSKPVLTPSRVLETRGACCACRCTTRLLPAWELRSL